MAERGHSGYSLLNPGFDDEFEFECNLCREQNVVTEGIAYCLDCSVYLCKSCLSVHKKVKSTADHKILHEKDLPISPARSPTDHQEQDEHDFCELHSREVVTHFCLTHKVGLCKECKKTKHSKCTDVTEYTDVNAKREASRHERDLIALLKEFKELEQNRQNDLENLSHKHEAAFKSIQEFREKIEQHLDRLEKALRAELETAIEKHSDMIKTQLSNLEANIKELEEDISKFSELHTTGKRNDIFKAMEKTKQDNFQAFLKETELRSKEANIRFHPDPKLQALLENLRHFGHVYDRPDFMTRNSLSGEIRDKHVRNCLEFNVREDSDKHCPNITGAVFLEDGRLVICDYSNHKVKLLSAELTLLASLKLPSEPRDIVMITEHVAVVTVPDKQQLQYLTISQFKLLAGKSKEIGRHCRGVGRCKDRLFVTCTGPGEVLVLDLEGHILRSCGGEGQFNWPGYITTGGDGLLYVSDGNTGAITCISQKGLIIYSHEVQSLKGPRQLVVDEDQYVYVCDYTSNNVQVISPDGKLHRKLITAEDGLKCPRTLAFRSTDETLIVGMKDREKIAAFKLT